MFHATLITMSRKYFFGFPRNILFGPKILKVFLESTFVHVSCYPDHCDFVSRKYFFGFRSPQLPFDIYDFGLEVSPLKCDLGRQASPLQLELFLKYFLETTFLNVSCYPDHYKPKIFFSVFLEILFSDQNFLKSKYF